jgi:hypothetical protein
MWIKFFNFKSLRMKKFRLLLLLVAASLGGLFIYSCQDSEEQIFQESDLIDQVHIASGTDYMGDLRLPKGTEVKFVESGFEWKLPKGWALVGYGPDNRVALAEAGGYTCTCSGDNGCDTIYGNSSGYGCLQASCSGSCTGSPDKETEQIQQAGFVDFNQGISFIQNAGQLEGLYEVPDALLAIPEIQQAMRDFNVRVYGNEEGILPAGDEGVYTMLNFYGTKIAYLMPTEASKRLSDARESLISAEGPDCSCSSGSSGCTLSQTSPYTKCDGGTCTSCKLTVEESVE